MTWVGASYLCLGGSEVALALPPSLQLPSRRVVSYTFCPYCDALALVAVLWPRPHTLTTPTRIAL